MFTELGISTAPTALDVARYYRDILNGFVLDSLDEKLAAEVEYLGIPTAVMSTLMLEKKTQTEVARGVLHFGQNLVRKQG